MYIVHELGFNIKDSIFFSSLLKVLVVSTKFDNSFCFSHLILH